MQRLLFAVIVFAGCSSSNSAPIDAAIDAGLDACVPTRTCESPSTFCGSLDDGCGTMLTCGDCTAPLECGIATPNVCGISEANRVCNPGGWCWQHPLPFGMNLTAIWGVSGDDLWATGEGGTLMRYDGTGWKRFEAGTDGDLHGVWGAIGNDIWITGSSYLRRFNGVSLATVTGAPDVATVDVHGTSATDVWLGGSFGPTDQDLWHFDGANFVGYTNPGFFGVERVFAVSPTAAFATTFGGNLMWSGTTWTEIPGSVQTNYDAWAPSATDGWFVGWNGVHRFDGTTWSTSIDPQDVDMYGIDGSSSSDVFVAGTDGLHHFDGTTWTDTPTDAAIRSVMAQGAMRTWAAGDSGRTLVWNGTSWVKRTGFGVPRAFYATWASDAHDLWLLGEGAMRWRDGQVTDYGELAPKLKLNAAWGASATDIWAGGSDGKLAHWDGTAWTVTTPVPMAPTITAMWGLAANDVYAVTEATQPFMASDAYVLHWDGTAWSIATAIRSAVTSSFGSDLIAIGGTGPADIWVGFDNASMSHWDGSQWTTSAFVDPLATTSDIWTSPAGTVWLATDNGVYRRTGTAWTLVSGATRGSFITGTSDTDVWVTLGTDRRYPTPLVAHYDGSTWTTVNTGTAQKIGRLAITADSIFAAGQSGGLVRKPR